MSAASGFTGTNRGAPRRLFQFRDFASDSRQRFSAAIA